MDQVKQYYEDHHGNLRDEHAQALDARASEHADILAERTNHHEQVKAGHESTIGSLEDKISSLEDQLEKLQRQHAAATHKLERNDKTMYIIRNALDADKAEEDEDSLLPNICLPNDCALNYVKNALHEVLYSVDPR